ncbi:hypothetical protein DWG18_09460 [Lysobacter sp. TY2-98]|uniref:hypothetical protein n=1 Tax=Lysobacter sp. TY2-98 TaxID=2290922 RepID=UPI000E200215|nr:hypothetical protein [Lysobacter sp. TY2-98]AXK72475.1 hypothetical protein DWG18_09460 [Lysobacter sp. TY2-98]
MDTAPAKPTPRTDDRRVRRIALASFVITFPIARLLVYMIMARTLPDLYLNLGGTHVHHLNYGIFALAIVGAALLFWTPGRRARRVLAVLYGVGMALTFDEFGMWLHLGGSYWQRSSFDAVVVVLGLLALLAYGGSLRSLRRRSALMLITAACLAVYFAYVYRDYANLLAASSAQRLHRLEADGPQ